MTQRRACPFRLAAPAMLGAISLPATARAEEAPAPVPQSQIVVFGRGEARIGSAAAASEGSVAGADLLVRPLVKVSELLEAIPGMVAAQHSGSGKANQYFLRGFNLDHGTDFTTYVDDVQMNLRSHGHGQGYLDLNGLIPEVIERETFRKGPYRADGGDFALAGAAYFQTIAGFDAPWASVEAGSYGWRRLASGGSFAAGPGRLTIVAQAKAYDGPWQQSEHLRHYAGFAKWTAPVGAAQLAVTAHAYRATWRPTEQIPERIVGSPVCADVFCSPDPTARGQTTRLVVNAALTAPGWRINAYAQHYDWSMLSNPTYADASGASAQIWQFDRRQVYGLKGERTWTVSPALDFALGTENRYDAVGNVGVAQADAGRFVRSLGFYRLGEASAAVWGAATLRPLAGLRLTAGLRGDWYHASVHARDASAVALGQGSVADAIASPKLSLAWSPAPWAELYANWGEGFHSNDVRGAVSAAARVPLLVRGRGRELGLRLQRGTASFTATWWALDVASELRFVGDSNAVEPSGASRRHGIELVGFWRPAAWLAIDANFTLSHSRYDNDDRIPNAFENAGSAGFSLIRGPWEAALRVRHLGPSPLVEDNSVRDRGSTVFNLRAARKFGGVELYADLLNLFDSRDKDIAYYYESYVPAFDAAPVEGRLSRVVEPRTLRIGVKTRL
ncbi:TonB-dependent receptor [Novosphingobium olei]|uniref:TonB-dependent receptor n=1 Tax=Novosphingobium olei TaxID=2728851 RepID=A0A7Y0BL61_9SPHN|nr:TonB-dependent receptor [Novosphingobium olei]NML92218.1 TonB-dependent receptor [Novosphingobium olei]